MTRRIALTRAILYAAAAILLLSLTASAGTTTVRSNPRFQAVDPDSAALLAGGKLQSYTCGTVNPTSTYADSTGTVANANPTILDGSGSAAIWLDPAVCYKLVLKKSDDSVIWTLDNINTAAAGSFTTLTATGAATFSSTVSATQYTSTIATGTAPFVVSSTTAVANLNASLLLGSTWAIPGSIGSTTPNAGAFTTLSASGNATLSGTTTLATTSQTGLATRYNNIALTGDGLHYEVATVDLTAQTAAVTTTTLYAVPASGAGQYLLSWDAKVTTAAGVSSTLGALTIVYTDPDGVAQTITAGAQTSAGAVATTSATNTTAAVLLGLPMLINAKASTNITYAMAYTSNAANAMNYNLHIKLRK